MERPSAAHSSVDRRRRRHRGCAEARGLDRSRAPTVGRGSRLEGRVGGGGDADQLARRRAARLLRVRPTEVTDLTRCGRRS